MVIKPFSIHALLLVVVITATYLWTQEPALANYNLQLTGLLCLAYFGFKAASMKSQSSKPNIVHTLILIAMSILLVFSTGGLSSPLFFILDLLLFAIALLFEPSQSLVASVTLSLVFIFRQLGRLSGTDMLSLASLLLMSPVASLFSRNYLNNLENIGRIKVLKKELIKEETESLLWITKDAKPSIATVLNSVSDIVIYLNSFGDNLVPKGVIDKLKATQKDLIALYTSTDSLEKDIKEISDSNHAKDKISV